MRALRAACARGEASLPATAPDGGAPIPRSIAAALASRIPSGGAIVLGVIGVALLYLQCLSPTVINYDARWYHLAIAADYAREGRLVPFYADFNKCFPQLASLIHTWDWLVPGLSTALRCALALHQELATVLWALAGVAAGAAWFAERERIPGAWAGFFLFPIVFVYDSNIGGGADHVLGLFAVPLFLATVRALEDLAIHRCALVGILTGGALLTRYQSIYLLVPVTALVAGRWLDLTIRHRRAGVWRGPLTALAVGAAVVLPHFLKNVIFYRNPFYPFAIDLFPGSRPRQPDTPFLSRYLFSGDSTIPRGPFFDKLGHALSLALSGVAFRRPLSFGCLFTLATPLWLFVRGRRRLALGVVVVWAALVIWGMTYPVERYVQAFMPLLAAVTVALLVRAWELGGVARAGVLALVILQVVWSADIPFSDGMGRLSAGMELIRGGLAGGARGRFEGVVPAERAIARRLPRSAVLLFHNTRLGLGVDRKVLQDLPGFQALIDSRHARTVRDLYDIYRRVGITHVVHEPENWPAFSKQEEVLFATLLARHAVDPFDEGPYQVFALPEAPPPIEPPYRVLSLGLPGYADGAYPIEALSTFEPVAAEVRRFAAPAVPSDVNAPNLLDLARAVDAVMIASGQRLPAEMETPLGGEVRAGNRLRKSRFTVFVRRPPASDRAAAGIANRHRIESVGSIAEPCRSPYARRSDRRCQPSPADTASGARTAPGSGVPACCASAPTAYTSDARAVGSVVASASIAAPSPP